MSEPFYRPFSKPIDNINNHNYKFLEIIETIKKTSDLKLKPKIDAGKNSYNKIECILTMNLTGFTTDDKYINPLAYKNDYTNNLLNNISIRAENDSYKRIEVDLCNPVSEYDIIDIYNKINNAFNSIKADIIKKLNNMIDDRFSVVNKVYKRIIL